MSKKLFAAALLAGLSVVATPVLAEGLKFLPILESGYKAEPTLAVSAGVMPCSRRYPASTR